VSRKGLTFNFPPWRERSKAIAIVAACLVFLSLLLVLSVPALAQTARHPFAVGANEGTAGSVNAVSRFILAQESSFYRALTGAVRALKDGAAAWGLIGLSFAYGVFHAAGPGHGKAVIASYMLANERTLGRGLAISLAAALVQGLVAIAIVGMAALIFHANAKHMTAASQVIEIVSYGGMTILGALLVARKGRTLILLWRDQRAAPLSGFDTAFAGAARSMPAALRSKSAFVADDGQAGHRHGPGCGHVHGLGLAALEDGNGWRNILLTIFAAGLRPCSGAILVLVFALAQGIFLIGALSVAAMSLGTALTTGALAGFAVSFKKVAARFAKAEAPRAVLALSLLETCAALLILGLGLALLAAALVRIA
jgi:nickel/cobalt exporter